MSGTRRGMAALADLQARQLPAYQQPLVVAPGDFRYPTFGAEPRTPPPAPAPRIAAPAVTPAPATTTSPLAAVTASPAPQQTQPVASNFSPWTDSPDQGVSPTGFAEPGFAGPEASSKFGADPLGPDPAQINSLADLGRDLNTMANFGFGMISANPVSMARAVANSPVGIGLAKSISAMTGISRATQAPEDLDSLDKPAAAVSVPSVVNALANMVGFGAPAKQGGPKGAPKSSPEEVEAAPATTATPAAATPTEAAPTVTAQDVPAPPSHMSPDEADLAGVDLGSPDAGMGGDMGNPGSGSTEGGNFGAGADGSPGGSLNSDPSSTQDTGTAGLGSQASQAESNSPGAGTNGGDGGGKGDSAGDGSNGESSAGSDAGGEKRMGGPIRSDGDGRLSAVPITAHEGEFVLSPEATEMVGVDLLQRINNMALEAAGHPPRPIDPQAHIVSPLSRLRAGAVPPSPGRPGASLLARPGQQGAPVYRGPLPMPGHGGAPVPAAPTAGSPLSFVSVSAPPPPGGAPPLPGAPPGPFPAPPTMPMGPGQQFAENGMEGMGQPMIPPPPAPPGAQAPNRTVPAGGGLTTDQLNGISLDLARGTGAPPAGGPAREAYERIAGRMQGDGAKPAYRMGGMVHRAGAGAVSPLAGNEQERTADMPWGQYLPHALHEPPPMIMFGYDPSQPIVPEGPFEFGQEEVARRFGPGAETPQFRMGGLVGAPGAEDAVEPGSWEWEGGEDGAGGAPSVLPRSSRPYAEEGGQDLPFGDDPSAPAGGSTMDDVKQRLLALPPEMQQAVAAAIGGNPMVASALLQVLGPHFAPLIQAAMTATAPPPPDPMAALMGGGGAPMQPIG